MMPHPSRKESAATLYNAVLGLCGVTVASEADEELLRRNVEVVSQVADAWNDERVIGVVAGDEDESSSWTVPENLWRALLAYAIAVSCRRKWIGGTGKSHLVIPLVTTNPGSIHKVKDACEKLDSAPMIKGYNSIPLALQKTSEILSEEATLLLGDYGQVRVSGVNDEMVKQNPDYKKLLGEVLLTLKELQGTLDLRPVVLAEIPPFTEDE